MIFYLFLLYFRHFTVDFDRFYSIFSTNDNEEPIQRRKSAITKGQQHPKDFPGGHPPQYYPGLARLNFGVRKGSGAFDAVWPLTKTLECIKMVRNRDNSLGNEKKAF